MAQTAVWPCGACSRRILPDTVKGALQHERGEGRGLASFALALIAQGGDRSGWYPAAR
jgi:hypothetical protein